MNTDILKKYCEKDNLNQYEILFLTYAKDLGLDPNLLDQTVISKISNNKYRVSGLIWQYEKILNSNSAFFENNLYIALKKIIIVKPNLQNNQIKQNINNKISNKYNVPVNQSSNSNGFIPIQQSSNNFLVSSSLSNNAIYYSNPIENYTVKLDEALKPKQENQELTQLSMADCYLSLKEFFNNFILENGDIICNTYIAPKFKIVITH